MNTGRKEHWEPTEEAAYNIHPYLKIFEAKMDRTLVRN